ncbi:hypothetical protein AV926_16195 [Myroides marinus]|uniref:Reactive intermediate/imine deaminase n=1 Tax=Myroides marinus TaxID=703342 RepID=A0A163WD68_9FLAO|nr:hypothetical protein AV926_16195 [Myroides marinus]
MQAQEKTEVTLPLSSSLKVGDLLFISGQIGIHPKTSQLSNSSFEEESKQVMENLKNELKKHNLTMEDLVSTTIYLKDMKQYDELNKVYSNYFMNTFPTRTCIAIQELPAKASVEISAIAHFKNNK